MCFRGGHRRRSETCSNLLQPAPTCSNLLQPALSCSKRLVDAVAEQPCDAHYGLSSQTAVRAINSRMGVPFWSTSAQPAARHRARISGSSRPVRATTVPHPAASSGATRVNPSPSGSLRSSRTSRAGSRCTTSSASDMVAAVDTRRPAFSNRMHIADATVSWSSTTRTCACSLTRGASYAG